MELIFPWERVISTLQRRSIYTRKQSSILPAMCCWFCHQLMHCNCSLISLKIYAWLSSRENNTMLLSPVPFWLLLDAASHGFSLLELASLEAVCHLLSITSSCFLLQPSFLWQVNWIIFDWGFRALTSNVMLDGKRLWINVSFWPLSQGKNKGVVSQSYQNWVTKIWWLSVEKWQRNWFWFLAPYKGCLDFCSTHLAVFWVLLDISKVQVPTLSDHMASSEESCELFSNIWKPQIPHH